MRYFLENIPRSNNDCVNIRSFVMKNKKNFLLLSVTLFSLVLAGCDNSFDGSSSISSSSEQSLIQEYTITFDSMGGSPVASEVVKAGQRASRPDEPTKDGNNFTGWYTETETTNLFDFSTPIERDWTLYAGWEEAMCTVTFDPMGGSAVSPVTVRKGQTIDEPEPPTKDYCDFTGWFKEPGLFNEFDFNSPILNNMTLYAGWSERVAQVNLKTAVFADIQLSARENGPNSSYYANAGNTVHAYVSLKNHFALCKEQGVDVIFMDGDIVNNAITEYYALFEEALTSVYGTDESEYPEIIYNMGNHEWWDLAEQPVANAVSLFNQHARIDTAALVRRTSVTYSLNSNDVLPTYYKVVKGVPFLVISGENDAGLIGDTMKAEITSWLEEISELDSVKNGGPIYVAYHCALHTTLTHGNGAFDQSYVLEELLADYPQAVVFTGDTHYSGVNERAINQVDFTAINIGSSSYSRMDKMSATMTEGEHFYNMKIKGGKTSDELLGDAGYKHEYTPTIHIMNTYDNLNTTIDRYFSTDDAEHPTHINQTWNIPRGSNKTNFQYTNARFENVSAAQELYGANGVSWSDTANVRFGVKDGVMTVIVPDTNEYHYTEHYKIEVSANTTKEYDVVGNYYIYNNQPGKLYFTLSDLPSGSNYYVKVTAYDYFDNPSLNYLTSSVNDVTVCADAKDDQFTNTYYELSTHLNYEDHTETGNTSLEYYYNGVKRNEWGAPIGQLIRDAVPGKTSGGNNISEYLSIGDTENCEVILKAKIKNLGNSPIKAGYTLYAKNYAYKNAQIQSNGQVVPANGEWTSLEWNITSAWPDVVGRSGVTFLALIVSADGYAYNPDGYEMHLLLDDMDVEAGEFAAIPETPTRNNIEMAKFDNSYWRGNGSTGVVTYTETRGQNSTSAIKVTFENSGDLVSAQDITPTDTHPVKVGFDLAQSAIGTNNNIDANNCILSFDIKMSQEFFNSGNSYRHMFSLNIEDETWAGHYSWLELTAPDAYTYENTDNGWIHVERDLANYENFATCGNHTFVMTFGFFGINTTTQQTAYVVFDNIALIAKS